MNPDAAELPLRDIHAAAAPPFWPPAPGWWILALLGLIVAVWFGRRLWMRYRAWRFKQALKLEYAGIVGHYQASRDAWQALADSATFFRRLLVHVGGYRSQAGMVGEDWAEHLASVAPDDPQIRQLCQHLARDAYKQQVDDVDATTLSRLADCWIDRCVGQGSAHV
jgi:hypothetical protein